MPEPLKSIPPSSPLVGMPDDDAVIEWLLAGDPAIVWQTQRDLLDQPTQVYESERSLVATTGWGRRLLDHKAADGTWGGGLYSPKWTSTTYTLLLLRRCGLQPTDQSARRGVELIWDGARYFDGGLTSAASIDAPEACVTSMYLSLAYYFGVDHPKVDPALDWLLANQLPDGGWNCRTVRFGDEHSSFHTSILALEAIAEAQRAEPNRVELTTALSAGREFFLQHHLYQSHHDHSVVSPAFTKLSFPPRWHYDVLRGLEHFAATNAPPDHRYDDALDLLHQRRRNGAWPTQNKHRGTVWFDMEQGGRPSRWNTLRALRVCRWNAESVEGGGRHRSAVAATS